MQTQTRPQQSRATPANSGGRGTLGRVNPAVSPAEALSRLSYLVDHRYGAGLLAGPARSGKSALLRRLADRLVRSQREVVHVDCGGTTVRQLSDTLAEKMRLWTDSSTGFDDVWNQATDILEGRGHCGIDTVFLFDDADRSPCAIELLRRLASFRDTCREPRITVIVTGQSPAKLQKSLRLGSVLHIELQSMPE